MLPQVLNDDPVLDDDIFRDTLSWNRSSIEERLRDLWERRDRDQTITRLALSTQLNRKDTEAAALVFVYDYFTDLYRSGAREAERRASHDAARADEKARLGDTGPDASDHDNAKARREWLKTPAGQAYSTKRREEKAAAKTYRAQQATRAAAYDAKIAAHGGHWSYINHLFTEMRDEAKRQGRLELTAELLGSRFAVGDGRQVTWGKANVDDHVRRLDLLSRNVKGNLVTMRLHREAVRLINEHGVTCLAEIAVPSKKTARPSRENKIATASSSVAIREEGRHRDITTTTKHSR